MEALGPRQRVAAIVCGLALTLLSGLLAAAWFQEYVHRQAKAHQVDDLLKPFYTEEEIRKKLYDALAMAAAFPLCLYLVFGAWRRRGFVFHHPASYWLIATGIIGAFKGVGRDETWWVSLCGVMILISGGEWIACLRRHSHTTKAPASPP